MAAMAGSVAAAAAVVLRKKHIVGGDLIINYVLGLNMN